MKAKERIVVDHEVGAKLARIFGVTRAMVSQALRGKTNSARAKKIRHVAVREYGGIVMIPKRQRDI